MTADPAERVQMLTAGGRVLRVATRDGDPGRPPLLLCNGIGGRLELFQPFVNALDPRRGVLRFDIPGIGESPAPVVPYHLATLATPGRSTSSASRGPTCSAAPPARGYYYQLLFGIGWTSLPRLRKPRPLTLILAGDDDPIIPLVNARIMHRLISHTSSPSGSSSTR
jgi:pimeloyl-ACP methyl ester carboxylesterase